ncbi:alpha-amylase family glycosyl hydrolase [Nitratireductor sp. GISD-1A_MAKvit]|uniref:beta-galactosidase BglA n=1 Tax=Nitratireductor sp. GISD-1A_MAKvit TaxID=3234198 RepID=UPI003466826C
MNVLHKAPTEPAPGAIRHNGIDTDWWRGAVIYQIYPRSFQDSNGDGVGDLKGITQRLPYIASLGVDAIWISPFFKSPMLDFGYDVSDYRKIDPMFGTLADFDTLIAEAHRLGLKVIIDQVISHSSDQHPWFIESRQSRTNPRADWYVWADPRPDGSPPNNWLSIFGGSAWEWDTGRCQYYLHNFLTSQPDLNFHNPGVQDALLDAVRFWLERGVDGFRLDTVNFYVHSAGLENNPPLEREQRNASIAPAVNPYNYQDHLYDKNQPENLRFLKRFRSLLDEYPGTTAVGEVGDAQRGLDIVAQYTSGGDKVHMCYSFEFLSQEKPTPHRVREVIEAFEEKAPDGWSCWSFSNHDVVRHASRWADQVEDHEAFLKMTATLLLSLRGSVCLYQGEELGLTEAVLDFEDLQDPYGIRFWPTFRGRDGCRTPMVWSKDGANGGFSDAKPWLPVPPEHLHLAVSAQERSASLLSHYRKTLAFRARHPVFAKGAISFKEAGSDLLIFERSMNEHAILVAINMSGHPVEHSRDLDAYVAMEDAPTSGVLENGILKLPPYGAWFGSRRVEK